ncbi:MAG: PaaI family thioesterase [Pseudomonadota bacterium]|nr:PaaI family thioesterase [Pseudomonadota bacterium]
MSALSDDQSLTLTVPFKASNMNMGGRTHGGKIATFLVDAAKLLVHAHTAQAPEKTSQLLDFQVSYLKGGGRETLTAQARITRRTQEFIFVSSVVVNSEQEPIAQANVVFRHYDADAAESPTHHNHPTLEQPPFQLPGSLEDSPHKNIVKLFNQAMKQAHPGSAVDYMAPGICRMVQADYPEQYDFQGNISAGQLLTFFDNVGGGSGSSLASEFGLAVTLTIQAAFCEPVAGEDVIGYSQAFRREQGLSHNQIHLYGADSGRLKAFGTMTHLVRPPRRR